MRFVYALRDPGGTIRYVGLADNPYARLRAHLAERGTSPKCRWLTGLLERGLEPELQILERGDERLEKRWIRLLLRRGFPLVNVAHAGRPRVRAEGVRSRSEGRAELALAAWREIAGAPC